MKLYTKRGDAGTTGLFGGQIVDKDATRIEAYGTVDELNAAIGWCLCGAGGGGTHEVLLAVQHRLFAVGAELATPPGADTGGSIPHTTEAEVTQIERWIDAASERVEPLRAFILPGGSELSGRLHLARTVCRRAERRCVTLSKAEKVPDTVLVWLNRLSDLLFALARVANAEAGVGDVEWVKPAPYRTA